MLVPPSLGTFTNDATDLKHNTYRAHWPIRQCSGILDNHTKMGVLKVSNSLRENVGQ